MRELLNGPMSLYRPATHGERRPGSPHAEKMIYGDVDIWAHDQAIVRSITRFIRGVVDPTGLAKIFGSVRFKRPGQR